MASQNRMMTLIAFLQAQNCSNLPGSWRHPATMPDFLTPEYYQRIARTLEDGKIQMAFFDDRLALPDIYTGDHAAAIAAGVRAVKLDPCTIIMAMGMATQRLGLGATYSTTYYEPYHVARVFATMDLMLKGRAAWNIVTSLNRAEAANFGGGEHMAHDDRYDRADEFMEVVLGHWNTWEDDALILDKSRNRFADPAKVHRLDHRRPVFPITRPVQRAALAAGAAGADPSGTIRPRSVFCREMGRSRLCDLPQSTGRHPRICCIKGRCCRRRPRSRHGACGAGLLCVRRRDRDGGGRKARDYRSDGARCRCPGAALRSAELRFRQEADR